MKPKRILKLFILNKVLKGSTGLFAASGRGSKEWVRAFLFTGVLGCAFGQFLKFLSCVNCKGTCSQFQRVCSQPRVVVNTHVAEALLQSEFLL